MNRLNPCFRSYLVRLSVSVFLLDSEFDPVCGVVCMALEDVAPCLVNSLHSIHSLSLIIQRWTLYLIGAFAFGQIQI
jgi:hypothetical protein